MSSRYKVRDNQIPHFVTSSVIGWVDVFSREQYKELICDSLAFCQKDKGLILHAWVIMSNHIHLIISAAEGRLVSNIMHDFKKYTSKKIINATADNVQESRKEWMLNMFSYAGKSNSSNEEFQFWKQDYNPIALDTPDKMQQRLNYLHENPVRAGMVWFAEEYKYSSALDYYKNRPGILPITMLYI